MPNPTKKPAQPYTPTPYEQTFQDHYDMIWSNPDMPARSEKLEVGWHFGYRKPGDKTPRQSWANMNTFIGETLNLTHQPHAAILDAGCGIGATTLHLAAQYPDCTFTGLTLAANEVTLATQRQHDKHLTNAHFIQGSFLHTTFPNDTFHDAFALESASHAENKHAFLAEMHRILKPNGTLLIIDLIPKRIIHHPIHGTTVLQGTAVALPRLLADIHQTGFTITTVDNLLHHRRVSLFEIFQYTFLFSLVIQNSTTERIRRPTRGLRALMETAAIIPSFILKILSIAYSNYGYYVITAKKTT